MMKRKHNYLSILFLIVLVVLLVGCSQDATEPVSLELVEFQAENSEEIDVPAEAIPEEDEDIFEPEDVFKYAIVKEDDTEYYIIQKMGDGSWKEIMQTDSPPRLAGSYDNKLYIYDHYGFAYIELNDTNISRTPWLDYQDPDDIFKAKASNAVLIGDIMYFSYDTYPPATEMEKGLRVLKLSDTSFDDSEPLIPNVAYSWTTDKNGKSLIYSEGHDVYGSEVYQYDLSNGETTFLIENAKSFRTYKDGHILYITGNILFGELYLYDPDTKTSQLILAESDYSHSGTLYAFADYRNGDVYYKDEDNIVKYNNGARDVIYTYDPSHGGSDFYGFDFVRNDTIELIMQSAPNKYLIDETEMVDVVPEDRGISVKMADGTMRFFDRLFSAI